MRAIAVTAKKATSPVAPVTYWLTRDSDAEGVVSDVVDVWLAPPVRRALGDRGAYWIVEDDAIRVRTKGGDVPARHTTWDVEHARAQCGTAPDDDRQAIRVGDDPPNYAPVPA